MTRATYNYKNGRAYRYESVPIKFVKQAPCGEQETIKFANGIPVLANNIVYDGMAEKCLRGLHIKIAEASISRLKGFIIECHDIEFKCISQKANKPTKNKVQKCLKRMRDGKCPYKIAKQLFTNIPNKKSR